MTSPPAHLGRSSHDVSRRKVGRIAPKDKSCENTRSATTSANRSGQVPQVCRGARAPPGRGCRGQPCPSCVSERLLRPGSSTSPWLTVSCCRDGSFAVIQPNEVQQTAEESSFFDNVHPHFACYMHVPVRVAGIETERYCPAACATSLVLGDRDRSSWNGRFCQDRSPQWISHRNPKLFSIGQHALAPAKVWKSRGNHLEYPAAQNCSRRQPTLWDSA